jgi:eukaryotic-like serine/threonine-protein kinase
MTRIADFDVVRLLGEGAFGQVFLCEDVSKRELRAIKTLRGTPPPDSPDYLAMRNEIALAPRIIHPNVVRVYSSGEDPTFGHYLVEEYVDGPSLRAHLDTLTADMPYEVAKP